MTVPPVPDRIATYRLRHVWSTGTDADTSVFDDCSYEVPPGVVIDGIGRSQIRAFGPPATPALDDTLPNFDGRYSPGGPLGSFVGRGPETTFDATWGTDVLGDSPEVLGDALDVLGDGVAQKRLFLGAITTAPQDVSRGTANVQVRSLGQIWQLTHDRPVVGLLENVRTDEAITAVLDASEWPMDKRVLDTGDTMLRYFWTDGQTDALSLINQIVSAEGVPSCWYVNEDGVLHFEGRQYRATAGRSVEPQYVFYDSRTGDDVRGDDPTVLGDSETTFGDGLSNIPILSHVLPTSWGANPDEVVVRVTTQTNTRTPTALMKIWEYGGPLTLAPLQVLDLPVVTSDPFKLAETPVLGRDYVVTSGAVTFSLIGTSGQVILLRAVAGSGGATVNGYSSNGPMVQAISLPVTNAQTVVSTVAVDLAAARYEPKPHTLQIWPEVSFSQALSLVNNFVRRYQQPRDQMTITVANLDYLHMHAMLTIRVSDKIRIIHSHGAISANFFVETLHHDLSQGGGLHILTLGCERATDDVPSRFGTARFGFDRFSE
jgi:hypothetical protein